MAKSPADIRKMMQAVAERQERAEPQKSILKKKEMEPEKRVSEKEEMLISGVVERDPFRREAEEREEEKPKKVSKFKQ